MKASLALVVAASALAGGWAWLAPAQDAARATPDGRRAHADTGTPQPAAVPQRGGLDALRNLALPKLLASAQSGAAAALLAVIEALGRLESSDTLLQLSGMVGEIDPSLLSLCSASLGSPKARLALLEGLTSANPAVALAAARALALLPGRDAAFALAEAVRSGDPALRPTALQALLATGAPEGQALAQLALSGNDGNLAKAAAESLLAAPSPQGRQLVLDLVASSDPAQRAVAAHALALAAAPDAAQLGAMLALAQDAEAGVRRPVLVALSQLDGNAAAAEPVLQAAAHGGADERLLALELLGNMTDRRAGELIAAAIGDAAPPVAAAAIRAAAYRLGAEVDNAVAAQLIDARQPAELRQAAAQTLWLHQGPLARLYAVEIQEQLASLDEPLRR